MNDFAEFPPLSEPWHRLTVNLSRPNTPAPRSDLSRHRQCRTGFVSLTHCPALAYSSRTASILLWPSPRPKPRTRCVTHSRLSTSTSHWRKRRHLIQCFSNFNVHTIHLGIVLKSIFWFITSSVDPKTLHLRQAPNRPMLRGPHSEQLSASFLSFPSFLAPTIVYEVATAASRLWAALRAVSPQSNHDLPLTPTEAGAPRTIWVWGLLVWRYNSSPLEQAIEWTMLFVRKIESSLRNKKQFRYTSRGQHTK